MTAGAAGQAVINEIDYDQPGTDATEFVEIKGTGGMDLTGWTLTLYNGSTGAVYMTVDLSQAPGGVMPGDGYLVIGAAGVSNVDIVCAAGATHGCAVATNIIQNGAPDGAALCNGATVVDVISYEGTFSAVGGCAGGMSLGVSIGTDDGINATESLSRCDDGTGSFLLRPTSPGVTNDCPAPSGACCDTVLLVCTDGVAPGACVGPNEVFTLFTLCANLVPPCEPSGACCNISTGVCNDGVFQSACNGPNEQFTANTLCANLIPPCVPPPSGACCNTTTYTCADGVLGSNCQAVDEIFTAGVLCANLVPPCAPPPVINEFVANHSGTDTDEFIEVYGAPNTDYSAYTVLHVEGDPTSTGVIDSVHPVGMTDANGIWSTAFLNNKIENGTITLLLVAGFTGVVTNDIDADNDGVIDNVLWVVIDDCVGVWDGGVSDLNYCSTILDSTLPPPGFTPGGASRIPNGADTDTAADWARNDFDGDGLPSFPLALPAVLPEAVNTPSLLNMLGPCGNGVVDDPGEQCDTAGETPACDANCTFVSCGDGTLNVSAGEQCDDGNLIDGDGCQGNCMLPICGDGIVDVPAEECDGGDCCTASCLFEPSTTECRMSAGVCDPASPSS